MTIQTHTERMATIHAHAVRLKALRASDDVESQDGSLWLLDRSLNEEDDSVASQAAIAAVHDVFTETTRYDNEWN